MSEQDLTKEGLAKALEAYDVVGFPGRLREALSDEGVRPFSRRSGISEGALRSYLRGDHYPALDRLALLAWALGVKLEWLAAGSYSIALGEDHAPYRTDSASLDDTFEARLEKLEKASQILRHTAAKEGLDLPADKAALMMEFVYQFDLTEEWVSKLLRIAAPSRR